MTTVFRSINPKNNKLAKTFEAISNTALEKKIDRSYQRFRYKYSQGLEGLPRRYQKLGFLKEILEERRDELATAVVQEMGKPIGQAHGEITKSIQHLDYYMNHSDQFLAPEKLDISSGQKGVLIHQPLGPIVGKCLNLLNWC